MIWHQWQSPWFPLIPSQKIAFKKKLMLKTDSAASMGSHEKYMKYVC
jgi:hypothetical protein